MEYNVDVHDDKDCYNNNSCIIQIIIIKNCITKLIDLDNCIGSVNLKRNHFKRKVMYTITPEPIRNVFLLSKVSVVSIS